MSMTALYAAGVGCLAILVGLLWRLRKRAKHSSPSAPEPVPGLLTRSEVWAHTQALAEHFRACGGKTGYNCADQVMFALNEFVCGSESTTDEV